MKEIVKTLRGEFTREISTPVGRILDTVIDCENGRFVSTNSAAELVGTTDELMLENNQRERLGNAACQTIRNEFTMQRESVANLSLYSRLGLKM